MFTCLSLFDHPASSFHLGVSPQKSQSKTHTDALQGNKRRKWDACSPVAAFSKPAKSLTTPPRFLTLQVGVPANRIFIINPRGELRRASLAIQTSSLSSLKAINSLVGEIFPPLAVPQHMEGGGWDEGPGSNRFAAGGGMGRQQGAELLGAAGNQV